MSFINVKFKIFILMAVFNCIIIINLYSQKEGNGVKIKTVVIDAGHGGRDPGAVSKYAKEKDIALAVALKLGNYIETYLPDVKVVYTRKTDEFVELFKRAEIANKNNADLFISIHVNASRRAEALGTETFVMGLNKTQGNLDVAMLENSVILKEENHEERYGGFDPSSPEAYIIFSFYQNIYLENSLKFASMVQNQFKERVGRTDRGVKQAGFLILWKTSMPSVLVELGFLSNEEEAKFLIDDKNQNYLASAIFRAFRDYKNEMEGNVKNVKEDVNLPEIEKVKEIKAVEEKVVEQKINKESEKSSETKIEEKPANEEIKIEEKLKDESQVPDDKIVENITETKPENEVKIEEKSSFQSIAENLVQTLKKDSGIVFKIQVFTSSEPLKTTPENFKGIDNIEMIQLDGFYKYFYSNFNIYAEAVENQSKIRKTFPDAFIVPFKNGKKITISEALLEIKE